MRIDIAQRHLNEVEELVAQIREARAADVRPRLCGCTICSSGCGDDVRTRLTESRDLTMILGIGSARAVALERVCGIRCWDDLAAADPYQVADALRSDRVRASAREVDRWRLHATALIRGEPAVADVVAAFPVPDDYIAVDLEYEDDASIWLVGLCIVENGIRRYAQLWAADPTAERRNLRQLVRIADSHPELPLVTWAGRCADVVALGKAAHRLDIDVTNLLDSHIDLYADWAVGNIRLPTTGFGVDDVAGYFNTARHGTISGGFEAVSLFRRAVANGDEHLRAQLLEYNRDDLDALIAAIDGLRTLADAL